MCHSDRSDRPIAPSADYPKDDSLFNTGVGKETHPSLVVGLILSWLGILTTDLTLHPSSPLVVPPCPPASCPRQRAGVSNPGYLFPERMAVPT